jgi:hypothetical protein
VLAKVNKVAERIHQFPPWVVRDWQEAVVRVRGALPARLLWDRVLTADDRSRLGGDLGKAFAAADAPRMWMKLRGVTFPQAVFAVGTALDLLAPAKGRAVLEHFGDEPSDLATALDRAIEAKGLVLTEFPRKAWWNGKQIEVDWAAWERPWILFWELGRQSKAGKPLDRSTLLEGLAGDPGYVAKQKSRLIGLPGFPADLAEAIKSEGRGTYRLIIPADQIRVFARGAGDLLLEWIP